MWRERQREKDILRMCVWAKREGKDWTLERVSGRGQGLCWTVGLTASFSEPRGTLVSCLLIYYFYLYLITTSSVPGTAHCRFKSEENRQVSLL